MDESRTFSSDRVTSINKQKLCKKFALFATLLYGVPIFSARLARHCVIKKAKLRALKKTMRKSAVANRTDGKPADVALVRPEHNSTQWTNELRRYIRVYATFNLLTALLSLDGYTRTVVYAFLIKGWSSSRIAEHLDVSVLAIQGRLEDGREQLKRKLAQHRLLRQ